MADVSKGKAKIKGWGRQRFDIRLRITLIIVGISSVVITAGLIIGSRFLTISVERSIESDMLVAADIADKYVTGEINMLKIRAAEVAREIRLLNENGAQDGLLDEVLADYPMFIGLAIFKDTKLTETQGDIQVSPDLINEPFMQIAVDGGQAFSNTMRSVNDILVIYISTPISEDSTLVTILSGHYFRELVSGLIFWESGHLFITDGEGTVVGNTREEWVEHRYNFIEMSKTDSVWEGPAIMQRRGIAGERGIGRFSINDVPRICAFRPLSSPTEDWFLGIIAPLDETVLADIPMGILLIGIITLLLSIGAAIPAANYLKRPYQEAEAASVAKSTFLANMSHEVRTPMNAILGITEIELQNSEISANTEEALSKIYESGNLLLNIINDILDFSKIDAGKMEIVPIRYDMPSLIHDTVQLNRLLHDNPSVEFKLEIDENTPLDLYGDELRIRQVLNNILSNAFKYTENGKIVLSVGAEAISGKAAQEDEVMLVFRVSDTGRGMTKEQLSVLFEEYTRFFNDTNQTIVGTGLGMSITRHLLTLMNGEIIVESKLGEGTIFIVRLPQKQIGTAVCGPQLSVAMQNFHFRRVAIMDKARFLREYMPYGSVLVVDDVESNTYVTRGMLMPYGLHIEAVTNGLEVIEKIREGNVYDVIFMDHMMPKMDGVEATKVLREMGYKMPIIALTANAIVGQAEMFMSNGFDGYISKPIDSRELNSVLNDFIRNRKPQEVVDAARREQGEAINEKQTESLEGELELSNLEECFIIDAESAINEMDTVIANFPTLSDVDIESLMITIHGMKSALNNIGERSLSDTAKRLEEAGNTKNITVIVEALPEFMEALRILLRKMKSHIL